MNLDSNLNIAIYPIQNNPKRPNKSKDDAAQSEREDAYRALSTVRSSTDNTTGRNDGADPWWEEVVRTEEKKQRYLVINR